MKKIFIVLLGVLSMAFLAACTDPKSDPLKIAVNYNGNQFISYNQDAPYKGLDGVTYSRGDLLPVWAQLSKKLDVEFKDVGIVMKSKNTNEQFEELKKDGFVDAHLVNGTGVKITEDRESFIALSDYFDKMPNLKKFVEEASFGNHLRAEDGKIYYAPYLDGIEETELGFLMRIDWTEAIIDGTRTGDVTTALGLTNYKKTLPASLETTIKVANSDGTTRNVVKKYSKNIIDILTDAPQTGAGLLEAFRSYITTTYGTQGYTKLSDVFVGTDAAYDADELVALMAVVKANPQMLRGQDSITALFPRENKGSRVRNLFRGLEMFGLRGAVSKNNWLYFDKDDKLVDSRKTDALPAFNNLNNLYKDQLIIQDISEPNDVNIRQSLLEDNNGFLLYDYNGTSTVFADSAKNPEEFRFETILPPVNNWKNDGTYFHFTESVRMLKNEAWGITKETAKNKATLEKALQLVDVLYETSGDNTAAMHLLPGEWRDKTTPINSDGVPQFSQGALDQMQELTKGNMIDYLRKYLGATLPVGHVRDLGLEVQTLSEQGLAGYNRIRTAVKAGTFKLLGVFNDKSPAADKTDPFYKPVPNIFQLKTAEEADLATKMKEFNDYWKDANLYNIVVKGIGVQTEYEKLFEYNGVNWYPGFLAVYTAAYNKVNN